MGRLTAVAIAALILLIAGCSENDSQPIDCTDAPVLSLEPVSDEHLWVADYPLADCGPLTMSFLFRNTSEQSLSIEEVRVADPRFSASADLPRELDPGQTIAVTIGFRTDQPATAEEAMANIVFASRDGCFDTEVKGLTVTDGGLTLQSAAAIDFGDVPLGETRTQDFTISWQRTPSSPAPRVGNFAREGEEFALVSAPATEFEPDPCDTRTIRVAFTAPATPGLYQGAVVWEQESQGFFGLIAIPLFANAVASER